MQLNVLARGDVQNVIRVLLGDFAQHIQLLRGQLAVWDLDALHARRVPHRSSS
jgi:hypothetical protein